MRVIDITDPENPTLAGSYDIDGIKEKPYGSGNYLYAPAVEDGIFVFDISDPENPDLVGSCDTPGEARAIHIVGDYAYVADGDSGIQILDITIPDEPFIIGSYDVLDRAFGIYATEDYAYVPDSDSGLHVVSVADNSNPYLIVRSETPGRASRLFVQDEYIYVADGHYLSILRYDRQTPISNDKALQVRFMLSQNYPNPFNAATTIRYSQPEPTNVTIEIYDILGRKVETLVEGEKQAGNHQVSWDSDDASSGVYFFSIRTEEFSETKRMLLLK